MGRAFVFTNSNTIDLGRRKRTLDRHIVIGPNAIKFVALTIIAVLAVVYLSQSTAGASRSLRIRDLDSSKGSLMLEKERLEAEQTRLRSLKEIDGGIDKPVLEPVTSVDHVENDALARIN